MKKQFSFEVSWRFVHALFLTQSFPLLFKVQTAILITFSYGIFQVWIAIIFESFTKYAQYLPILAARGDKADHCWYHFNQIQTFKFGWYHLPCGEPISACASFVNLLSQFASNMLCDFNMLPMPFSQASAWVPNFPISQMATSSTHPVVLELRRDSMRSVGWLGWLCWLGWGRKNTGMTWNGHCFSSRHLGISCCCIWHHLTRKDGRRMDEGERCERCFFMAVRESDRPHSYQGRVPRKPEPESCDLRWSQMGFSFQIQHIQPSKSAKCPTLDIAKVVIFLVISQASP